MTNPSSLAAPLEVVLDIETQGLRHADDWWEVAAVVRRKGLAPVSYVFHNRTFDVANADPKALELAHFYDRHPLHVIADPMDPLAPTPPDHPALNVKDADGNLLNDRHVLCGDESLAFRLERLTRGAVVWGCNPHYDLTRIDRLLARHHRAPSYHYRPMCATTWAAGVLSGYGYDVGPVPYTNSAIGDLLHVPRDPDGEAHQGLVDCNYALKLLDAARGMALDARAERLQRVSESP